MLLAELVLLILAAAAFDLDGPLGRLLIKRPAEALNTATPRKALLGAVVLVGVVALLFAAPEFAAILGIADLSTFVELAVLASLIGGAARLKAAWQAVRRMKAMVTRNIRTRFSGRAVRRGAQRPRRPRPPADEGGAGWVHA